MVPVRPWLRRNAPELALAVLGLVIFLGHLGSLELWGKREQRAAAETLDTLQSGHWLIAEIQGRPRLEKPPLPRWSTAALMLLTGRRDEWVVRLPGALSALGTLALVYLLGRWQAGRSVGVAAAGILASSFFFISEMRQAGNDGPLTFFTTLALSAAWRRLHGRPHEEGEPDAEPARDLGNKGWALVFHLALGLGFLTKGPVILLLVAVVLIPYLLWMRRLGAGLRALADAGGLLVFVGLALCWPIPVALADPQAVSVWLLEMGQKAGSAGVTHHQKRQILATEWLWMTAPWGLLASWGVCRPLLKRGRGVSAPLGFAWLWTALNLLMFCGWKVAKPNYYLPCLPGVALLVGMEWVRLVRMARETGSLAVRARVVLQSHWVSVFVAGAVTPVAVHAFWPVWTPLALVVSATALAAAFGSAVLWRRGGEASPLLPLVGLQALLVLVVFGRVGPLENPARGHRELAGRLEQVLPPDVRTVHFFHELDEGLWFYLRDRRLVAVPGSAPKYNDGYDLLQDYRKNRPTAFAPMLRLNEHKQHLLDWMADTGAESSFVLIRAKIYDLFEPELAGRATVVLRERDRHRNDLVLLRVNPPNHSGPLANGPQAGERR